MLTSILRCLSGYLRIRIAGQAPERFLNACAHHKIPLWNLTHQRNTYEMYITVKGFRQLKQLIRKTGTNVTILRKIGVPFFIHRHRKQKVFLIGVILCFVLIYRMSVVVWDIDISGNRHCSDETLLDFLASQNITHGMKKSRLDCEDIVKKIRREYDEIIWVSASIDGTRLKIQIKENEDSIEHTDSSLPESTLQSGAQRAYDILADYDCQITGIITRNGVPQVTEGTSVRKGDVLVSGRISVYNDSQEVIDYTYVDADASIRGEVALPYESACPLTYQEKKHYNEQQARPIQKKEFYLNFGSWQFRFGSIRHSYSHFILWSFQRSISLTDDYQLPVSYGTRTVIPYLPKEKQYTEKEIRTILSSHFQRYLNDMKKKGVEIIGNDVKIYKEHHQAVAKGTIHMITDIGTKAPTEMLPLPQTDTQNNGKE